MRALSEQGGERLRHDRRLVDAAAAAELDLGPGCAYPLKMSAAAPVRMFVPCWPFQSH